MTETSIVNLFPGNEITTLVDAERALKNIVVAESAETMWERAKDPAMLFEAIKTKLLNQAAYAVWRQDVAVQGGDRKSKSWNSDLDRLPAADPGKDAIARWRERLCIKISANRWRVDDAKLRAVLGDVHARCVRICEQENMGTVRGTEGTGEFERYTPAEYINLARDVMGDIDLDPASSEYAQKTVRAKDFFTVEDDGLTQDWHGRIWLNPPYHRELAPKFIDKLIKELEEGHTTEAVVLTNNSTDTAWFRVAAEVCDAICFTTGRIHFEVPNAKPVFPTQGQAFFYFGHNLKRFLEVFSSIGLCVEPVTAEALC